MKSIKVKDFISKKYKKNCNVKYAVLIGIGLYDFQISVSILVSADKKIQNIGGYRYRPI